MRPERRIIERDGFYTVERSSAWFFTTDRTLAEEVRKRLDADDPLPHIPFSGQYMNAETYREHMRLFADTRDLTL